MKKTVLILIVLVTLLLVSCRIKKDDKPAPDYGETEEVYVFTGDNCTDEANTVIDCFIGKKYTPVAVSDLKKECDLEIIIGNIESKDVSKHAYNLLYRIEKEDYFDSRYLVYSDGDGSIAIAFDTFSENYVGVSSIKEACEIINHYINNGTLFSSEKGVLGSGKINLVEKQQKIDDAMLEEQWNDVFIAAGGDEQAEIIVNSLKQHYNLYTDGMLSWIADLYDPIAGVFYYSNSGRNTEGYLADIESTSQIMDILNESGMFAYADNDFQKAFPDFLKEGIIRFIKSRQDPNGFFYHPQWTHETVDANLSRRARDLSKAIATLKKLGALPTYPNPLGSDYDGIDAEGNRVLEVSSVSLTEPFRNTSVLAVSKVVATATAVPAHLVSDATFREWLAKLDVNGDSYFVGNNLSAQSGQIVARDKQLKKEGKNYLLSQILIDWLNEHCYESTGHWSSVADYEGINGLLKISGAYIEIARSGLNVDTRLPYPERTLKSLVDALRTEEYARTDCYAYNVWYSICNLFELEKHSDPVAGAQFIKDTRAMLLKYVTEDVAYEGDMLNALEITTKKTANFRKIDGSFSQTAEYSAANSQGLPVAVPYTNEGDVNATALSSTGITSRMFAALGLPMPDIFTHADAMMFFNRIENLGAVIKDEEVFENTGTLTFEDYEIDEEPRTINNNSPAQTTFGVDYDPQDPTNKVLRFTKTDLSGQIGQLDFGTTERIDKYNAFVFETDIMFDFADDENFLSNYFYLRLGTSRETFGYYLAFSPSRAGTIRYQDISNTSDPIRSPDLVDTGIGQGEWFNLKVEYYIGDQYTTRILIYINGGLSYVSNNFYGPKKGDPAGTKYEPLSMFTTARIHTDKNFNGELYFDNFNLYQAKLDLPEYDLGKQEPLPKDVPNDVLTFEEYEINRKPGNIVASQNTELFTTTVVNDPENAANKVLKFSKFNDGATYGANVKFVPHKMENVYNAAVFSTDLYLDYCDKVPSTLIFSMGNHKKTAFMLMINRLSDGKIRFRAISNSSGGTSEYYTSYAEEKEWFNLKVEYYKGDKDTVRIKVYINGELLFVTKNFYGPKTTDPEETEYTFVNQFTGATLATYGDYQGVVYFDNVSYIQTNLTCKDDPLGLQEHKCYDKDGDNICDGCKLRVPLDVVTDENFERDGVAILPVKGGANGIVTLIHDDGYYQTGYLLDELLEKYGLVADVGMVVSRVWDSKNNVATTDALEWQKLFDTGRWKIINHSMTHTFWGDVESGTVSSERAYEEVITSGEILRMLFPEQRVLTYAYPGISAVTNNFGMSVYDAVKLLVRENYIAGRNYSKTSQTFYDWDWEFMPAESIGAGYLDTTLNTISAAASGKIATIFVHRVVTDEEWDSTYSSYSGNTYTPISHMEAIASKISEYERAGKIWNANYEDAVLYLREAECASVTKTEKDGKIYVSVTHSLDKSIYDYPLTVKVKLDPSASGAAKVTQGDTVGYAYVKSEGDVKYACIDVKPNSEEAVVSIVELEDIPYDKIPEFVGDAVEHGCFDKNSDYYCDICKSMIAHNHVDADHDDVCDLCKAELPHVCYDADGDYICNKCENIVPHNCIDKNNDYVCDKCGKKIPHEHIDENKDTFCDKCGINLSDEYDGGTENMTPDGWS